MTIKTMLQDMTKTVAALALRLDKSYDHNGAAKLRTTWARLEQALRQMQKPHPSPLDLRQLIEIVHDGLTLEQRLKLISDMRDAARQTRYPLTILDMESIHLTYWYGWLLSWSERLVNPNTQLITSGPARASTGSPGGTGGRSPHLSASAPAPEPTARASQERPEGSSGR